MGKNKTKKNHPIQLQKGGVISIGDNSMETLHNFLMGSTINYLSIGSSGLVFICENTQTSEYYAFRPNNLATKVTKVILKLCIIHDDEMLRTELDERDYRSISDSDFHSEIVNQNDIVIATCGYFEPSMPTLLFASKNDRFDIIDMLNTKAKNDETDKIFQQFNQALRLLPRLKLGLIVMEHAGINEVFEPMLIFIEESGIDLKTKLQTEALAMYELIVLGVHGFYHGDHHRSNLLYTENSTTDYFLSEDGSSQWYTGKRILPIDAGRIARLDRRFLSNPPFEGEEKEQDVFNHYVSNFRTTGNPSMLREVIQMIIDGGFNYDHDQRLKTHPVYSWFDKNDAELIEIAGYVYELMNARQRAVYKVIQKTRATVSATFNGTADMNIIKRFVLDEINKQRVRAITLDIVRRQLTAKVIEHIKEQVPLVITERVARLQEELREDLDDKRGGKMVGGQNDKFFKFIEPIDLNELVKVSCFAIIFATYLTGKFNEVEPSFVTLTLSFEQEKPKPFVKEQQEQILFEQMPPFVSVSAGGKRKKNVNKKTRRKQKGGVIETRSNNNQAPARKERKSAKQAPVEQAPVEQALVKQAPVEQPPVKQSPDDCAICFEELSGKQIQCVNGHKFHEDCIMPWCTGKRPCPCPLCRDPVIIPNNGQQGQIATQQAQGLYGPRQGIYAPRRGEQEIIGQGEPRGLQFTLLPPTFIDPHSALSSSGVLRWPPNYRPTEQEIRDWGIQMNHRWWTRGHLPLGWYTYDDSSRQRDPNFRGIIYTEESYREDLADAPQWLIVENDDDSPPSYPQSSPQDSCSIM